MAMSPYRPKLKKEESTVRKRLLEAGFEEEFIGEDRPPATHYHYGKGGGFYAEFLAPLEGSEYDRTESGRQRKSGGRFVAAPSLHRNLADLALEGGAGRRKRICDVTETDRANRQSGKLPRTKDPHPRATRLQGQSQGPAVHARYDRGVLRNIWRNCKRFSETVPSRRNYIRAEYRNSKERPTGSLEKVEDTVREAALMAPGRKLSPERLAETARAGLNEIFGIR